MDPITLFAGCVGAAVGLIVFLNLATRVLVERHVDDAEQIDAHTTIRNSRRSAA